MEYALKIIISAVLITLISEIAKHSGFWAAVLASLPFTSILAFVFLYNETSDIAKVADLSMGIFWLVIPSLVLFLMLTQLLKRGVDFYPALLMACVATIIAYFLMSTCLKKLGIL